MRHPGSLHLSDPIKPTQASGASTEAELCSPAGTSPNQSHGSLVEARWPRLIDVLRVIPDKPHFEERASERQKEQAERMNQVQCHTRRHFRDDVKPIKSAISVNKFPLQKANQERVDRASSTTKQTPESWENPRPVARCLELTPHRCRRSRSPLRGIGKAPCSSSRVGNGRALP